MLEKYDVYPATFYYWKRKLNEAGEAGLSHGITKKKLVETRRLEKENQMLKTLLAEKELESRLKNEVLKKVSSPEKVKMTRKYISEGLTIDKTLEMLGITKLAYYYQPKGEKPGHTPTTTTKRRVKDTPRNVFILIF